MCRSRAIPKFMKDALLATEDPRFYQHTGIDYRGILRAALKNIMAVRVTQGGSTITQQLTKVVFLSPERKLHAQDQGDHPGPAGSRRS